MIQNTSKQKNSVNWFILIELFIFTAIIWFTCNENDQLTSLAFAISLLVLLAGFVEYLLVNAKKLDSLDTYLFTIVLFSFVFVMLSFIKAGKIPTFEDLKNYFIFLSTMIFFRLAEKIKVNKTMLNIIFIFNMAISLIYFYAKQKNSNSIDLNFSNPNLTGMFVFVSLLYMILAFIFYKNIFMKIICAVLIGSNFTIMYETEARNVLLAFVLFAVVVFLTLFKGKLRYSKAFNLIVNITPAVFVALYLGFIDKIITSGKLDFLVSEGKGLNSRVEVWEERFDIIDGLWLTGDYVNASGNAHNSHMVLLCSFGIVVLVLVTIYMYKLVNAVSDRAQNKFQTYCMAAFFAVIFMGFGEGALYSGGVGIYIPCGLFLVMANSNFEQTDIIEENVRYDKIRL